MVPWAAVNIGNPIDPLEILGPSLIWVHPNNYVAPIYLNATGGRVDASIGYTWNFPSNWWTNQHGNLNENLDIISFSNCQNFGPCAVQLNSKCKSVAKTFYFITVDDPASTGNGGIGGAIYPNPIQPGGTLNLELEFGQTTNFPIQISIVGVNSNLIFNSTYSTMPNEIQIGEWAPGVYVLLVQKGADYQTFELRIE